MERIELDIAGEITLSKNPGASLKKWREIFGITQTELAKFLNVTPSTISDYEGNRRKSPGINIIKRFISSIMEIDKQKGGWTIKKLQTEPKSDVFELFSFEKSMTSHDFCKNTLEGKIITNEAQLKKTKIYGCTLIDSIRAIIELPADEFIKIYGNTTERALIFTNVSMGRSPMIAIRVTGLKPSVVIMHNLNEVDKVAIKISEVQGIPVVTTALSLDEIKRRIKAISN